MPRLDILSLEQAQLDSSTGRRAQMLREYVAIIGQVPAGQAGKLAAGPGETLSAVRRRLGAAAKAERSSANHQTNRRTLVLLGRPQL